MKEKNQLDNFFIQTYMNKKVNFEQIWVVTLIALIFST